MTNMTRANATLNGTEDASLDVDPHRVARHKRKHSAAKTEGVVKAEGEVPDATKTKIESFAKKMRNDFAHEVALNKQRKEEERRQREAALEIEHREANKKLEMENQEANAKEAAWTGLAEGGVDGAGRGLRGRDWQEAAWTGLAGGRIAKLEEEKEKMEEESRELLFPEFNSALNSLRKARKKLIPKGSSIMVEYVHNYSSSAVQRGAGAMHVPCGCPSSSAVQ
eukprot:gene30821-38620_t